MHRDTVTVLGLIIAVILIGGFLFFYGPASFRTFLTGVHMGDTSFTVLDQGTDAISMDTAANYRIQNPDDLAKLWNMMSANHEAPPNVDFAKNEVLAVFDGTHPTGGYDIQVLSVVDAHGTRTVRIQRTEPGMGCSLSDAITAPYELIVVPKTDLGLTHEEVDVTKDCS